MHKSPIPRLIPLAIGIVVVLISAVGSSTLAITNLPLVAGVFVAVSARPMSIKTLLLTVTAENVVVVRVRIMWLEMVFK